MDIILIILKIIILIMIFITFRTLRKDYILSKTLKNAKEILDKKELVEDNKKKK